jgi:N-acetylneuraminate synthase
LYAGEEIKAGEKFTKENVRAIRPGDGLATRFYDVIIGKTASKDIKNATPLSWDNI